MGEGRKGDLHLLQQAQGYLFGGASGEREIKVSRACCKRKAVL